MKVVIVLILSLVSCVGVNQIEACAKACNGRVQVIGTESCTCFPPTELDGGK